MHPGGRHAQNWQGQTYRKVSMVNILHVKPLLKTTVTGVVIACANPAIHRTESLRLLGILAKTEAALCDQLAQGMHWQRRGCGRVKKKTRHGLSEVQDATEFLPCRELSCKRNLESEVSNFLIYCARRNSSQKSGPRGPLDFYHSIEEDDQHAIQQNTNNVTAPKP